MALARGGTETYCWGSGGRFAHHHSPLLAKYMKTRKSTEHSKEAITENQNWIKRIGNSEMKETRYDEERKKKRRG